MQMKLSCAFVLALALGYNFLSSLLIFNLICEMLIRQSIVVFYTLYVKSLLLIKNPKIVVGRIQDPTRNYEGSGLSYTLIDTDKY